MRIGIDARSLTDTQPTGIGIYAFHMIEALIKRAPQHEWFLFTSGQKAAQAELLTYLRNTYAVTHVHLQWPNKLYHLRAWFGWAPYIHDLVDNIDVMFAPNLHIVPLFTKKAQPPLVLTLHDITYALYPQYLSSKRKLWHWAVRPKQLLELASHVVAVSNATRQDAIEYYSLPPQRISTIYSGIPGALPGTPSAEAGDKPKLEQPLPAKYILLLATLEPRKNIAGALSAYDVYRSNCTAANIEPYPLVVVGSAGWKSTEVIEHIISEPYVQYLGYVDSVTQKHVLRNASMLLYPSIYEGFGFPALEALQANVPVIASQAGALPEVLGNAAVYVDPYVIQDIASAMMVLQTDEALRQQLIAAGQQQVHIYNWDAAAEQLLQVFEKTTLPSS